MTLGSSEFNAGQSTDDEDEGSLPHSRANPGATLPEKNRVISGCPPGLPQPRLLSLRT